LPLDDSLAKRQEQPASSLALDAAFVTPAVPGEPLLDVPPPFIAPPDAVGDMPPPAGLPP
jgi:hypothetical protein